MQELWTAVDRYISATFSDSDDALDAALKATVDAGMPEIQIAPNQGRFLQLLAQMAGARTILEIGTLAGYSTIWLARAVPEDGRVVTLELEQKHAEVAGANIARAGLGSRVEVRVGPALDSLRGLVAGNHPPFDFVFIDADKVSYPSYLEWSLRLSKPGTVIVADNIVRDGAVADANSTDAAVIAVRRYNEMLASDPRLTATVLQTVGSKGYDGFAIARVSSR
jgi:predicted O-methyltransferase YrrM